MNENGQASGSAVTVAQLEAALRRVAGVTGARVVSDAEKILEVHILSTPERPPKQLVRDVQSVALAAFGVEVDYRKISVVQLEEQGEQPVLTSVGEQRLTRVVLKAVVTQISGSTADVTVVLRVGTGDIVEGKAAGSASDVGRLTVEATVGALNTVLQRDKASAAVVEVANVAGHDTAVVLVRLSDGGREQTLIGTALVRFDRNDALARACLDAVNRIIVR